MKALKGKKALVFLLIFVFSLAIVSVGIFFFVRTFCFYTVSFDTNCDMKVESYRVLRGFAGHDPNATLRKVDYYFIEWCEDEECTIPYDFNTPVIDNITLYAHWGEANAVLLKYADGEPEEYITQAELDDYVNYLKPGSMSTVDIYTNDLGYTLVWFEDPDMSGTYYTEPTTFDLTDGNITLYGAWCDIGNNSYNTVDIDYCGICGERSSANITNGRCNDCASPVFKAKYIDEYIGTCRNVIVPQMIGGYRVKGSTDRGSEDGVFYESKSYLKKVILEDGFEKIGAYTFSGCDKLDFFIMGDDVTYIGAHAFDRCRGLKSVKFSNNIEYFGDYSFYQANNLMRVSIPDCCEYIGKCAFIQTNIISANIPGSVKTIGDMAFSGCSKLATVNIGDGVENIGKEAFGNTIITSIHLPKSVKVLGNSSSTNDEARMAGTVFNFNPHLTTVTIDENNPYFRAIDSVIYNKSTDPNVDMTILYFYPRAKTDKTFTIPESVIKIDNLSFIGAASLESVNIGTNVTYIGERAFKDCHALKKVVIAKGTAKVTISKEAFSNCSSLAEVHLERIKLIGESAFQACIALFEIVIPTNVQLKDAVFYGCTSLDKVVCLGTLTLPEVSYKQLFKKTHVNMEIYVLENYMMLFEGVFQTKEGIEQYYDVLIPYTDIEECELYHTYDFS